MSKYIRFEEVPYEGKTKRFLVIKKSTSVTLARIQWYSPWRQYCFTTAFETIWNKDCLKDIQDFIQHLMDERKILLSEGKVIKGGVNNISDTTKQKFIPKGTK